MSVEKYEEIKVDLPDDIICDLLWIHAVENFTEPSQSILKGVLDIRKTHGQSVHAVFEAAGRALFNEIMHQALTEKLKREGFLDNLDWEPVDEDTDLLPDEEIQGPVIP